MSIDTTDLTVSPIRSLAKAKILTFGNEWIASKTGTEIIDALDDLPKSLQRQGHELLNMEEVSLHILELGDLATLKSIPCDDDINSACAAMNNNEDCIVRFNKDLTLKPAAVRAVAQIHRTKQLAEGLHNMTV